MIGRESECDVFVVGGGPAGLATAILAAQKGLRVVVADHATAPFDKACGEGLLPDTVESLNRLGVRLRDGEAVPLRGIRFLDAKHGLAVDARFPGRSGLGVRRTALHANLLQRATAAGVSFAWGARVSGLAAQGVACDGARIRSRWVVGADGEDSQVRKWVFPGPPRQEQIRYGFRRHFQFIPWTDFVEVHWGDTCQITVTPVGAAEICLAVTSRNPHTKLQNALLEVPKLAERVAGAVATTRERGAAAALRQLRQVCRGRYALVGDASGSLDPVTGAGLGVAFRQADALTDALRDNDLKAYQAAHARIGTVPRLVSRLILLMDAYPWFRERVLRALASEPQLFSRILNVHIQALAPSAFGAGNAALLGWRVIVSPG
jgi:flavin-dependent dehydrogenase